MQERKRHPGRMGIHRADPNTLQNIPLPIYPRSLGNFLVPGDYVELVPEGTKNFVQFFWCVDGEGEFELEGTPVTVRAGDCFYHLPMPFSLAMRPCSASSASARRNVGLLTPYSSASACSAGRMVPAGRRPMRCSSSPRREWKIVFRAICVTRFIYF